ncbi:MCU family protein [Megaselia abdita]
MCGFTLKPVTNNVGDFIKMLQTEDKGIDRAAVFDNNGVRIASSCNIEALLDEPFCIQINNILYRAEPPAKEKLNVDNLSTLGNVKNLVEQLYEALQVDEHYAKKEKELIQELETLKQSISPLEAKRNELNEQAARNTNLKTWLGLGLMSVQFGILARLTWWEYSWDIMEPVTFFVGYGTSIALYAYFCMTKMEYNYNDVANRHYLLSVYKSAKIKGLDVEEYNNMKRKIAEVEFDLKRLKDPLYLQLPPHFQKSTPPSKQRSRIEDND